MHENKLPMDLLKSMVHQLKKTTGKLFRFSVFVTIVVGKACLYKSQIDNKIHIELQSMTISIEKQLHQAGNSFNW